MIKPCFVTCLNQRPEISPIMLLCADRLDIAVIAGVHEPIDQALVNNYGQIAVITSNDWPGKKWNDALKVALEDERQFTHFIIIGDDDSLSTEGYRMLLDAAILHDYAGFRVNAFYDIKTKKAMQHKYTVRYNRLVGAGRIISRRALERVCYKRTVQFTREHLHIQIGTTTRLPVHATDYLIRGGWVKEVELPTYDGLWEDRRRSGLDNSSEINLLLHGVHPVVVGDGRNHVTDFKSYRNIWPYSILEGKCQPIRNTEDALWFLSEAERKFLDEIKW